MKTILIGMLVAFSGAVAQECEKPYLYSYRDSYRNTGETGRRVDQFYQNLALERAIKDAERQAQHQRAMEIYSRSIRE